jgi:hypothetical protein
MACWTRLAGLAEPRRAVAGIALATALAVAGCAYEPYPAPGPEAGPPPGYAPQAAPGYAPPGYAPSAAAYPGYAAQPPAYMAQPPAYGAQPPAYAAQPAYAAPGAYREQRAYGGPAAGVSRDTFIAHRREVAMRKGRDPERAAAIAARRFDRMDTDHDGILTRDERQAWRAAHGHYGSSGQGQGQGQGQAWQQPPAAYR